MFLLQALKLNAKDEIIANAGIDTDKKIDALVNREVYTDADGNIKQEAYAEVMIPRWSNLIPKDYPIEQLEKEGLDIQIAYRLSLIHI